MLGVLNYMKGYLRIKVWGFAPERFMNLCSNKGILIWNIQKDGDVYCMNIGIRGFYQLKGIAKKTGTKVAILERYGLTFFIQHLKGRAFFLCGLALSIVFWMGSSLFLWDIDLSGNQQITDDSLMTFLKESDVRVGMLKSRLHIGDLEKEIRRRFEQITWISGRLSGTKLILEMKENESISSEGRRTEENADIVAEYDGIIISIIVREGVPQVSEGEHVEAGCVLVSGKVPIYNDDASVREYHEVCADADIVMEHQIAFEDKLPFGYVQQEYTGRMEKKPYLKVGEKEFCFSKNSPYLVYDSIMRESRPIAFEKLAVPIYFGERTFREYQNVEYLYTPEQAKEMLSKKINAFLSTLEEKGVHIIEKDVKIDTNGRTWIIRGDLCVQETCGKRSPILEQEIGENEVHE